MVNQLFGAKIFKTGILKIKTNKDKTKYVWLGILAGLLVLSFCLPKYSGYKYFDQNLSCVDIPPVVKIKKINDKYGVYVNKDLQPVLFDTLGNFWGVLEKNDANTYVFDNKSLILDMSQISDFKNIDYDKIKVIYNNRILDKSSEKLVWNKTNILGTDKLGRDLLTRVFQGIKISLLIGLTASIVNLIIGVLYGSLSGYLGGKIDAIMNSFLNIINSIPAILLVILLSLFVSQGLWTVIIIIGSVYWVSMARQVRAGVMMLKQREFVLAEIVLGTSNCQIIFKHIIPNLKETILTTLITNIQNAIFTESLLSFLGLGVSPPTASLGVLMNDAVDNFKACPYQLLIPTVTIVLILSCLEHLINES